MTLTELKEKSAEALPALYSDASLRLAIINAASDTTPNKEIQLKNIANLKSYITQLEGCFIWHEQN